ncbi:hypothetical protein L2E82_44728 [Cichorium intybus]|uniref:Uncharacterized protein n=1 Tax=Cichorium intybus TaxID=13427 RepID=A0ACB8ZRJ9_CICIN|nr:hypothetical protein L2E82_44728 [Cichorium intybus]
MLGGPMMLPPGYDNQYLNNKPLMSPRANDKGRNQTKNNESESEDEEILWKTQGHLLTIADKQQIFDMMEAMERKHQEYAKDTRDREAKVFQLLNAQQQWINQKSIIIMAGIHSTKQVWGQSRRIARVEGRDAIAEQGAYRPGHQFLQFPNMLEETPHYRTRLRELRYRAVVGAISFDRALLTIVGLWDQLLPFIRRTWMHSEGAFTFTCQG